MYRLVLTKSLIVTAIEESFDFFRLGFDFHDLKSKYIRYICDKMVFEVSYISGRFATLLPYHGLSPHRS